MVIRATESFNLHCNNVARQVEEKCCPYYRTLSGKTKSSILLNTINRHRTMAGNGCEWLRSVILYRQKYLKTSVRFHYFKSYDRLYQHMYEYFRHSSLYQNRPIRANFIITTAYLLRSVGLFPTSVIFQAFTLLNSPAVLVNRQLLPWKLEHGFVEFLGSDQSSTAWPHFGLKYLIETSFQSWTSSRIR